MFHRASHTRTPIYTSAWHHFQHASPKTTPNKITKTIRQTEEPLQIANSPLQFSALSSSPLLHPHSQVLANGYAVQCRSGSILEVLFAANCNKSMRFACAVFNFEISSLREFMTTAQALELARRSLYLS